MRRGHHRTADQVRPALSRLQFSLGTGPQSGYAYAGEGAGVRRPAASRRVLCTPQVPARREGHKERRTGCACQTRPSQEVTQLHPHRDDPRGRESRDILVQNNCGTPLLRAPSVSTSSGTARTGSAATWTGPARKDRPDRQSAADADGQSAIPSIFVIRLIASSNADRQIQCGGSRSLWHAQRN